MGNAELYDRIIASYKENGSVKKTAEELGTSVIKVRRVLITEGLWSSATSRTIQDLREQGLDTKQIAEKLHYTEKNVQAFSPYTKGAYGKEEKSSYCLQSRKYRERKQTAADKAVKPSSDVPKEYIREDDLSEFLSRQRDKHHIALKLHLELDLEGCSAQDMGILHKYGKVEKSISRDIIVPADITLHALHYAIQKLFGWQNSHLHHYEFPEQIFNELTGGSFARWCSLAGIYFRFPDEELDDLYWDDDYEEGQSIKTWFRKKYTGPYRYLGEWEHYTVANTAANHDMKEHSLEKLSIQDMLFDYQGGMDELLERIPLIQLLIPRGIKEDPEMKEKIKFLQKRQEKEAKDIDVLPVAHELIYSYDFGDGWDVKITLEDCYYTKNGFNAKKESGLEGGIIVPVTDKQVLADKAAFDMNNQKLGKAMALKVAMVAMKKKPVGLSVDGLSLMDDVGGIGGYIDFLRVIHGEDPDEKEDMKEWAKWMGWTGRMIKPENLL